MIGEYMERKMGSERYARLRNNTYKESVDCASSLVFQTLVNGANERYCGGMEWDEVGRARVIGGLVNLSTIWIYTRYRDRVRKRFNVEENNGFFKKLIPDSITGVTFGWPVYTTIVALSSDNLEKVAYASLGFLVYCSLVSYPYSLFLDFCRKVCGTKPTKEQELYQGDV